MDYHGIHVRPSRKNHPVSHAAHHAKMKFYGPHAAPKAPTSEERHDQLTEQTQKWVAQTFFGQMLKQMRDSPFKSKMFDGGRGGEAFQQMADERTAESMARGTGHKLVDAIVDRIEKPASHGPMAKGQLAPALPPTTAPKVDVAKVVAKVNPAAPVTSHDWGHA